MKVDFFWRFGTFKSFLKQNFLSVYAGYRRKIDFLGIFLSFFYLHSITSVDFFLKSLFFFCNPHKH